MSTRVLLVSAFLVAALWCGPAAAEEAAAPPAAPEPTPPAAPAAPATAQRTTQGIYDALSDGDPAPLADAIDAEALLERTLAGLSARPSPTWRAAALARLEGGRRNLAEVVASAAHRGLAKALAEQPGPDGATAVAVRLGISQPNGQVASAWHRVLLRKKSAAWRVVDLEMLAAGEESGADLSNLALAVLFDPNVTGLPDEAASQALAAPAAELLAALVGGILLGLLVHRLLRRPGQDGKLPGALSGASFWLMTVAGVIAGLILFGAGLNRHLNRQGAVEELKQHGSSLARLQNDDIEGALKTWPRNQAAQARKAEALALLGKIEDAERYLTALTQTSSPPPAVYLHLANLQARGQHLAEAAGSLARFAELLGGDGLLYTQAAQYAATARDFRLAEDLLRRAEAAEPPDRQMLMVRVGIHVAGKKGARVVADFKAAMALKHNALTARTVLAALASPDFEPVRNDPVVKAFVEELKSGESPPAVGPVRRNP